MELNNRNNYIENQIDTVKQMIEMRLNKLKKQKEMLMVNPQADYTRMMAQNQAYMNPIYSYQFHEPIYYPLENPISGEPITLPKIELGKPIGADDDGNEEGLSLTEIVNIINQMNMNNNSNIPVAMPHPNKKKANKKNKKKKV